eukprot:scaffold9551_cov173-Skeletonema_marinoi.AAC.1
MAIVLRKSCFFRGVQVEGKVAAVMLGTGREDRCWEDHTDNRDCMCLGSDGQKKDEFSYNKTL